MLLCMTTTQNILVSDLNAAAVCDNLNRTLMPLGIRVECGDTAPMLWSFWDSKTGDIIGASDSLSEAIAESLGTWRLYCARVTRVPGRKGTRLAAGCAELVRLSEVVS